MHKDPAVTASDRMPSRRDTLKGLAAAALVSAALGYAKAPTDARFAYAGTYTGAAGNGKGIYRFKCGADGVLTGSTLAAESPSPSWLIVHPSGKTLYAGNEISSYQGNSGSVSAFAIDAASGDLRALNVVSSEGAGPAYITLDHTGRWLLVANYIAGTIAVITVHPDGSLGEAVFTHADHGSVGAARATNAPPDSFAVSGHDAPHAHTIVVDPANRFVLSTDLGQDRIYSWRFDVGTGKLTPNTAQPFVSLPAGDGPRHIAFHPNGRLLYSVQEEASTVVCFAYDRPSGRMTRRSMASTLPAGYRGTSFAAELLVSRSGRFLYAGNRLHNSVAVFSIAGDGSLRHVQDCPTEGDYCAQFQFNPAGDMLYACNHRSDNITAFRVDRSTGKLQFTGRFYGVPTPGCITFLA